MKKLYSFEIPHETEKDVTETIQNEDGSVTTTVKKQKSVEYKKFFIKKPTRSLYDQEELFRARTYKDAVQTHGLIPQALLIKRISEDEGMLSTKEKEHYNAKKAKYLELQKRHLELKDKKDITAEETAEVVKLAEEMLQIRMEFQSLSFAEESVYQNTAEAYVSRRVARWWILNLAYNDDNTPFFGEGDDKAKTEKYYEYDDSEDKFIRDVLNSFTGLVSMWSQGGMEREEDFDKFFKQYIKGEESEEVSKSVA